MLTSGINSEQEDVYLHCTTSDTAAESILEHGLYVLGNYLEDFSTPFKKIITEQDIEEIMKHEYNSKTDNFIVFFRMPKNEQKFKPVDKQESEAAKSFIEIRRDIELSSMQFEITQKVGREDILGYINKDKLQVILNPAFQANTDQKHILFNGFQETGNLGRA